MRGDIFAAKIETLFASYRDCPDIAQFYKSEGGVCALFGGRATLCGKLDAEELQAFLAFTGAAEIEGAAEDVPPLCGYTLNRHPVLRYAGAALPAKLPPGDIPEAYAILCEADARFAASSSRLEWLSDMRRRVNRGCAAVYTRAGAAVVVTALTGGTAVLGAVACRPDCRGHGSAASLVREAAAHYRAAGRQVYTIPADSALAAYYTRLGFEMQGECAVGGRI